MIKIGEFSKINRVTVKTLRYYDEIGLLKPASVNKFSGYRYYAYEQMPKLHKILAFKAAGCSLEEILMLLNCENTAKIKEMLEKKSREIKKAILEETQRQKRMDAIIIRITEDSLMDYNVIVKPLPEVIAASMRKVIKNYGEFNNLYPLMGEDMKRRNVRCAVPEYCFSIYYDMEYKETDIDVEICQAITGMAEDTEKVKFKKFPGYEKSACAIHKGPYTTIGQAYGVVFKWIKDNGYKVIAPPREAYYDGVWNKDDPNEWLTKVQVPIAQK